MISIGISLFVFRPKFSAGQINLRIDWSASNVCQFTKFSTIVLQYDLKHNYDMEEKKPQTTINCRTLFDLRVMHAIHPQGIYALSC